tara:strand:+ start:166 stop:1164 length:999 start_codon:yes stop_codon:yes gene_type:complete
MTSKIPWSLPEGVEEILPPRAIKVENLRRKLIDLYIKEGYEFIIPPLLELTKTLGGEAHDEIASHAFTFTDEVSNQSVSIRPDMSEQAARIDAYRLESSGITRLCYAGEVLKKEFSSISRSRVTFQVGSEIFGDPSIEADIESINLMVKSLKTVGVEDITLSIGESGLINSILNTIGESPVQRSELESVLLKKSQSDIKDLSDKGLTDQNVDLLLKVSKMYGDKKVINKAEKELVHLGKEVKQKIEYLKSLLDNLPTDEDVTLHLDLGEIPGFKYHTGVVFSAFSKEAGYCLSKGGRYDGLTKEGTRSRSAVGFDLDLLAVCDISSLINKHD